MNIFNFFKRRQQEKTVTAKDDLIFCDSKQNSHKICCARCKKEILEDEAQWIGNHRFCKNCANPPKAAANPSSIICSGDSDYEIILPKTLFKLYDTSTDLPGDNVYQCWADVMIDERGLLCIEENSITYSAHSIGHNTGRRTIHKVISFEQLTELIPRSDDPAATKYSGMNQANWRDYIKEPKAIKKPSKYPIITFGKFEWYILDQEENDTLLLLSKYGIDTRPWNSEEKLIDWTESTLCNWLNSDFIKQHFTQKEQRAFVRFNDGTWVSLLDSDLVEKYLKGDEALTVQPNQYALTRGAFTYTYSSSRPNYKIHVGNGLAWLKDTYKGDNKSLHTWAHCIYWDGSICMYSFDFKKAIVRPLIRIDRQKIQ